MALIRKTIAGALLVVEGLGAVLLGVAGLVVNGWWVNEGLVNVGTFPWWTTAAKTLAVWLAPIAIFSSLTWAANRWIVSSAFGWSHRATGKISGTIVAVSAAGSVIGALWFAVFKPHM